MATTRGFVERIEIGRGGLVTVTIVEGDVSRSMYVISDLDADPERFNERLSKLAVLRDAMNRAEPVEIEHSAGDAGEEIDRAARISRDELDPPGSVEQVSGLVLQVAVDSRNALSVRRRGARQRADRRSWARRDALDPDPRSPGARTPRGTVPTRRDPRGLRAG